MFVVCSVGIDLYDELLTRIDGSYRASGHACVRVCVSLYNGNLDGEPF